MTDSEFHAWLEGEFRPAFRDVDAWLNKLGEDGMNKTLKWWWRTLRCLSLEEATEATRTLFEQDQRTPSFSKIPAALRAIALRLRGEAASRPQRHWTVDGEETFACATCQDDGRVICRATPPPDHPFPDYPYTAAYACTCQAGEKWKGRKFPLASYNPNRHVLAGGES